MWKRWIVGFFQVRMYFTFNILHLSTSPNHTITDLSGEAETSTNLQQRWAKGAVSWVTEAVLPSPEPLLHVVVRSVFL